MNWLTNFIRPKIRSLVEPKEVPDNLWQKCPKCDGMLFSRDLAENLNVCNHCNHHLRLTVKERLPIMFDGGKYTRMELPDVAADPLKFKDRKKYADRIREARNETGLKDALTVAKGAIGGQNAIVAAFNFSYMGGSMGTGVGEGIIMAAEEAVRTKSALIIIPASGGARMQEGMLSLIQMPRTIIAVEMVKEARLPYIVILVDPTTGGVSASFAMVGDIHIAEPGATIGFAGRRVIEETVREKLPDDFQTAEYLREKGMVDLVVARKDQHETLSRILNILMNRNAQSGNGKKSGGGNPRANGKAGSMVSAPAGKGERAVKAQQQVRAARVTLKKLRLPARKKKTKQSRA